MKAKYNGNGFFLENSRNAIILIHGFTSSTQEIENLALELYYKGFTVIAPLLAGHNTSEEDFAKTTAEDYYDSVLEAYHKVKYYDSIDVVGFSLGAILALKLVIDYPDKFRKIVTLAPAIFFKDFRTHFSLIISLFKRRFNDKTKSKFEDRIAYNYVLIKQFCYVKKFVSNLIKYFNEINIPILIIASKKDMTIKYQSSRFLFNKVSSVEKNLLLLENSGHIITQDVEKEIVIKEVIMFLRY